MINPTAAVPSDNLYKFIAISGLFGAATFFWFPDQVIDQKDSLVRIQSRKLAILVADLNEMRLRDDKWLGLPSELIHDQQPRPESQSADANSEQARAATDRTLERIDTWLRDLADESATAESKRRFFEDPSLRKRLKAHRNWDEKQLNDWVAALALDEFNANHKPTAELAKQVREKVRDARFDKREFDALHDKINYYRSLSRTGVSISVIFAVLGFYLWFVRVQKIQDLLSSLELEERTSRITKTQIGK